LPELAGGNGSVIQLASYQQPEKTSAPTDWSAFLKQHELSDPDIQTLVFEKHESRQFKDVIGIIQACLIAGRPQPWMYQVLALTMEIEHYPKEEVERVLLSNNDFRPLDVPNLLVSAAYLTRFGAKVQALSMYRQASRLAPSRPEPYALGLKHAKDLKDQDAIIWAAEGILTYDWSTGFQRRHDDAVDTTTDLISRLKKSGNTQTANELTSRLQEASIRDLDIRLEWSGAGDLDLAVEEPTGVVCSFENPLTPAGGTLVHDGNGGAPKNSYDHYVCGKGFNGVYKITIRHAYGDIVSKKAMLVITEKAQSSKPVVTQHPINLTTDEVKIEFELKTGRRKAERTLEIKPSTLQETREKARVSTLEFLRNRRSQLASTPDQPNQPVGAGSIFVGQQAVGYRPIVTTLSDGVSLAASATVSADRRYVTLNLAPSFSTISDVFTFTFLGGNQNNNPPQ